MLKHKFEAFMNRLIFLSIVFVLFRNSYADNPEKKKLGNVTWNSEIGDEACYVRQQASTHISAYTDVHKVMYANVINVRTTLVYHSCIQRILFIHKVCRFYVTFHLLLLIFLSLYIYGSYGSFTCYFSVPSYRNNSTHIVIQAPGYYMYMSVCLLSTRLLRHLGYPVIRWNSLLEGRGCIDRGMFGILSNYHLEFNYYSQVTLV